MKRDRNLGNVLLHPIWLGSLALLVLNDHLLKGSGMLPGWVTGKLSDIAGMFVAPALFALVIRARSKRGLAFAHVAVGVVYAVLEMSASATAALDGVYRVFGHRWTSTSDWTDLLALLLLPLAYVWSERASRQDSTGRFAVPRAGLAAAGVLACVATTEGDDGPITCDFDCDMDGWDEPEDCNDYDFNVNPGLGNCPGSDGAESCNNGVDDNNDGQVDCADPLCEIACSDTVAVCSNPLPMAAQTSSFAGSTLTGSWALEGSCGGADAPENVFTVSAEQAGTLSFVVPDGHVAYARSICTLGDTFDSCAVGGDGETEGATFTLPMQAGVPMTLVIDAQDGLSASDYVLALKFGSAVEGCGDGVLGGSEICDDGNLTDLDGCSSGCVAEPEPVCERVNALLLGTTDSTFAEGSYYEASTCGGGGPGAPERGFSFTAEVAGVLTVSALAEEASVGLFSESSCQGAIVACAPSGGVGELVDLAIPLAAGASTVVFVEGEPGMATSTALQMLAEFAPD